jgi:hypothetical protein
MRKKILSLSVITLSTLMIGISTTHAAYDTVSAAVTDAISLTKSTASGDYGKFVVPTTMNRYDTIRFLSYQRDDLEGAFRIAMNEAYNKSIATV